MIKARTDEEGRAEVHAQADTDYFVEVLSQEWLLESMRNQPKVKAGGNLCEFTVTRWIKYEFAYSAVGFEKPKRIHIKTYGAGPDDPKYQLTCYESMNSISLTDNIGQILVAEPGCLAEELLFTPSPEPSAAPIHIELKRGPTVIVARAVLPADYIAPLKATAQAIKIDKIPLWEGAAQERAMKRYSSEFTPTEGDIVFGPLSPGKYALKILDANGKTLWEETREVK
jgi:hypothetical protein